jgi:hypothetical protein
MTEEEWRSSADPAAMLAWLERRLLADQRRQRLFVCACCRQAWPSLQPAVRAMVEAAEDAADREPLERPNAAPVCSRFYDALLELHRLRLSELEEEVRALAARAMVGVEKKSASRVRSLCPPATPVTQAGLLRELFGNPFRKARVVGASLGGRVAAWPEEKQPGEILFIREWLDWHGGLVHQLARAVHEERAFDRLPILADALEEAGCDEPEILGHLRGPETHVRGCWVLDLILFAKAPTARAAGYQQVGVGIQRLG